MAKRNRRNAVKAAPERELLTVDEAVRLAAEEAARLASEQTALRLSRSAAEPYSATDLRSALKQRAARQVYSFNDPQNFTTAQDPRLRPFSRVSVETLRTLARNYDILAACITHLKSEVVKVPLKVVAKRAHDDSNGTKKQVQQAKAFLSVTGGLGGYGCHREEYEALLLDDLLVIGAGCSFLEYGTLRARRDGNPDAVTAIDAATIRPLVTVFGFAPGPAEDCYEQWIQGVRVAGFKRDELIYRGLPIFARTDSPYWLSPVELLVSVVYTALKADEWNRTWLTDGNTPDWWMKMPDTMSPDQIIEWLDLFDTMLAGNASQRHKVKVTPGEPRTGNARKEADFAQFETWLMQRTCSVMGVNPASIGHHSDTYKDSQEIALRSTKDGRIAQLLAFRRSHYNELLERKGLFEVEVQDEVLDTEDAKARAERHQVELSSGQRTLNETRKEDGLEPYGHPLADVPLVGSSLVVLDSLKAGTESPEESDAVGRALRLFEKKALNRLREKGSAACTFDDEALPAGFVTEICGALERCGSRAEVRRVFQLARDYDPNEPRDENGKWTTGGAGRRPVQGSLFHDAFVEQASPTGGSGKASAPAHQNGSGHPASAAQSPKKAKPDPNRPKLLDDVPLPVPKIKGKPIINGEFPDFSEHRHPEVPDVWIVYTGKRTGRGGDFEAANKKTNHPNSKLILKGVRPPSGYTWHHTEDVYKAADGRVFGRMQLVSTKHHRARGHNGGVSIYEEITGKKYLRLEDDDTDWRQNHDSNYRRV